MRTRRLFALVVILTIFSFCFIMPVKAEVSSCMDNLSSLSNTDQITCLTQVIVQLTAQIAAIKAQQNQNQTPSNCYVFSKNLGYSKSGDTDIGNLHNVLKGWVYSAVADENTNNYSFGTSDEVKKYQTDRKIYPSGYFGDQTRADVNLRCPQISAVVSSQNQQNQNNTQHTITYPVSATTIGVQPKYAYGDTRKFSIRGIASDSSTPDAVTKGYRVKINIYDSTGNGYLKGADRCMDPAWLMLGTGGGGGLSSSNTYCTGLINGGFGTFNATTSSWDFIIDAPDDATPGERYDLVTGDWIIPTQYTYSEVIKYTFYCEHPEFGYCSTANKVEGSFRSTQATPSITMPAPIQGDSLVQGGGYSIRWNVADIPDNNYNVSLLLFKDGKRLGTIKTNNDYYYSKVTDQSASWGYLGVGNYIDGNGNMQKAPAGEGYQIQALLFRNTNLKWHLVGTFNPVSELDIYPVAGVKSGVFSITAPIVSNNCTPNWICSSYSSCTNGTQKRTCNDINNCGQNTNMPQVSATCTNHTIHLTYPVGGETWLNNNQYTIKWDSTGIDRVTVKIGRNGDPTSVGVIANQVPNTGFYNWTVPPSWIDYAASNYYIQLFEDVQTTGDVSATYWTESGLYDQSKNFSVASQLPPSCTPNWTCNSWGALGACSNGVQTKTCINMVDQNNCGVSPASAPDSVKNQTFTCSPSITVSSPNDGETWRVGEAHNINWNSVNLPANAVLSIGISGDGITSTMAGAEIVKNYPASAGYYSWIVPAFLGESLAGKKYSVYLTCTNCGSIVGYSSQKYVSISDAPAGTPTVDLRISNVSMPVYNGINTGGVTVSADLQWTSANTTSCKVSVGPLTWSGNKPTSGTEHVQFISFYPSQTFAIICSSASGSTAISTAVARYQLVDLKINNSDGPLSINTGSTINLSWNSVIPTVSCSSSSNWNTVYGKASGISSTVVPKTFSPIIYSVTCSMGNAGAAPTVIGTDSVTINPI
jgi:hypothetical protein